MITVIVFLQFGNRFLPSQFLRFCQFVYILRHLRKHFLLGDAADARILIIHRDIGDIVQLAEDAELRELGDAREENEMQMGVAVLQRRVEVAHDLAHFFQTNVIMRYIQKRSIVFINKHYHFLARLGLSFQYKVLQSIVRVLLVSSDAPFPFFPFEHAAQETPELIGITVLGCTHIKPQHGINRPILLHTVNVKSLEQLFSSFKVGLQSGDEQRLSKPTRAA